MASEEAPAPLPPPPPPQRPLLPSSLEITRVSLVLVGIALAVLLVVEVRWVLVLIAVALILAIGLQKPIARLEARGMRRGVAVALLVGAVMVVLGGFLAFTLPLVVNETADLADKAPSYIDQLRGQGWVRDLDQRFDVSSKASSLGDRLPDEVWSVGQGFLSALVDLLTIVVLTLYFAVNLPRLRQVGGVLLTSTHRATYDTIVDQIELRVGGYVSGNLVVSVVAGVTAFAACLVAGIPYAAALAFWVALTDLIPAVGALMGAALVGIVAAFTGWGPFIGIMIFFLVYQQIENYVLVPRVMRGTVNLSVGAVLLAILVGSEIAGFVGVLLALPVVASLQVIVDELYLNDRRRMLEAMSIRERRQAGWMRSLTRR